MTQAIVDFVTVRLKKLKEESLKFNIALSIAEKQEISATSQEKILSILDYVYTNYPIKRNLLLNYCPRPKLNQTEIGYFKQIEADYIKQKKMKTPSPIIPFLSELYKINQKYDSALCFIDSKTKHEIPNNFGSNKDYNFGGSIKTDEGEELLVQVLSNGDIMIANLFKGIKANQINITMEDSKIVIGDKTYLADKFNFSSNIDGYKIIFSNGTEKVFIDWMEQCFLICEEIIGLYKNI